MGRKHRARRQQRLNGQSPKNQDQSRVFSSATGSNDAPPIAPAVDRDETSSAAIDASTSTELSSSGEHVSTGSQAAGAAGQEQQILDELSSIQEYMTALLTRVRGENGSAAHAGEPPARAGRASATAIPLEPQPVAPDPDILAAPTCFAPMDAGELKPRSRPPEVAHLDAIREVASSQFRAAIDKHHKSCLLRRAVNNGAAGFACLLGVVVTLSSAPALGPVMAVGRMAAVVASVYFLYVAYVSARAWQATISKS
jgi:hypothetical protein